MIKSKKFLRSGINIREYKCYYCGKKSNLEELIKVDQELKRMDSEDHEFLLDNLPISKNSRDPPFIHMADLGYKVLNICRNCYEQAKIKK